MGAVETRGGDGVCVFYFFFYLNYKEKKDISGGAKRRR